jgi:hypothetical protein
MGAGVGVRAAEAGMDAMGTMGAGRPLRGVPSLRFA